MELEPLAWRGPLKLAFGLFGLQILHCKNTATPRMSQLTEQAACCALP